MSDFSVWNMSRQRTSMNRADAAGIWWKMPIRMMIFCSFSPFLETLCRKLPPGSRKKV